MFGILELVHLGVMVGDQVFNIPTLGMEEITRQPQVKVYATTVKEQRPLFVSYCTYKGVLVEYTRTWEEERNGTVWPAEPDKPAGFALIITRASCPHKENENERNVELFATGERGMTGKYAIREMERVVTWQLTPENHEKHTPKWLPQVMDTLAAEAPTNPAAKAFLSELSERKAFVPPTVTAGKTPPAPEPDAAASTASEPVAEQPPPSPAPI